MEDSEILELYFARDERAIRETSEKYSAYLRKIAWNILQNYEDCRECENDTYLRAWNTIPPANPPVFSAYLGKIVRESAIDRWRLLHRKKRGGTELIQSLEEMREAVPSGNPTEDMIESKVLAQTISAWLRTQQKDVRTVFLMRYFYMDPLTDIAKSTGFSQPKIKSILHRARIALKEYLEKEGYTV